jgi:3-hydroxybutyryl-CoA dehydrogenase
MAEIKTVGIVGAGQMGAGIAHVCSVAGYDILFHDVAPERIEAGVELVRRNMARQVAKGILSQDALETALARIKPTAKVDGLG